MCLENVHRIWVLALATTSLACGSSEPDLSVKCVTRPEDNSGTSDGAPCDVPGGLTFAELTAPQDMPFDEVAIAAGESEVAVAYSQWDASRTVSVFLQRFTREGALIDAPIFMGAYVVSHGQLASGGFYGGLTIAASPSRFLTCWGAASRIGCASIAAGSNDVSTFTLNPTTSAFTTDAHVVHRADGFAVFWEETGSAFVQLLGYDADPIGEPKGVSGVLATATNGGYAVISFNTREVRRLDTSLNQVGAPIPVANAAESIASLGDSLIVAGSFAETRIDAQHNPTTDQITHDCERHHTAIVSRNEMAGVAWTSMDERLRFRTIDAADHKGTVLEIGCAPFSSFPKMASTTDGFLVATVVPGGEQETFYDVGYQRIRVVRIAQP